MFVYVYNIYVCASAVATAAAIVVEQNRKTAHNMNEIRTKKSLPKFDGKTIQICHIVFESFNLAVKMLGVSASRAIFGIGGQIAIK